MKHYYARSYCFGFEPEFVCDSSYDSLHVFDNKNDRDAWVSRGQFRIVTTFKKARKGYFSRLFGWINTFHHNHEKHEVFRLEDEEYGYASSHYLDGWKWND